MNNKVDLTDDELSLVVTSLQMNIMGHEKYVQMNGENTLDAYTEGIIKDMKSLLERLGREYF